MNKYGILEKLINLVKAFYDGFEYAVIHKGERTEWFKVKTGDSRFAVKIYTSRQIHARMLP